MNENRNATSAPAVGSAYFETPEQAVDILRQLLIAKDWRALASYYDISGTGLAADDLLDGRFYIREKRPEASHPAGFWRYRHPFPPEFRYLDSVPGPGEGELAIRLMVEIDLGPGNQQQIGQTEFRMRRNAGGLQVLPPEIPRRHAG